MTMRFASKVWLLAILCFSLTAFGDVIRPPLPGGIVITGGSPGSQKIVWDNVNSRFDFHNGVVTVGASAVNFSQSATFSAGATVASGQTFTMNGATLSGTIAGTPTFSSTQTLNTSGNAGTATTLATARTLWGVNFNGGANVTGEPTFGAGATVSAGQTLKANTIDTLSATTMTIGGSSTGLRLGQAGNPADVTHYIRIGNTNLAGGFAQPDDTGSQWHLAINGNRQNGGAPRSIDFWNTTTAVGGGGFTFNQRTETGDGTTLLALSPLGNIGLTGLTSYATPSGHVYIGGKATNVLTLAAGTTTATLLSAGSYLPSPGTSWRNSIADAKGVNLKVLVGTGSTSGALILTNSNAASFTHLADSTYTEQTLFSITHAGAVTIGPIKAANYEGPVHKISGQLAVATPTNPSTIESGHFLISTNLKRSIYGNRYQNTLTGSGILLDTLTNNTSSSIIFYVNKYNDSISTEAESAGTIQADKVWKNIAGAWSTLSDRRSKKDVRPISSAIETIRKLNPVEFTWIDENRGIGPQYGFIAQEVEQVNSAWVTTGEDVIGGEKVTDAKAVQFGPSFDAHVVKAIQEQQAIIDTLKTQIRCVSIANTSAEKEACF